MDKILATWLWNINIVFLMLCGPCLRFPSFTKQTASLEELNRLIHMKETAGSQENSMTENQVLKN